MLLEISSFAPKEKIIKELMVASIFSKPSLLES